MNKTKINLKRIVQSSMLAAIILVATMIIRIPTTGSGGYVNIGDSVIIFGSAVIGGIYGALASAIGSMLADVLAGYSTYALATLIIKFLMSIIFSLIYKLLSTNKSKHSNIIALIISSLICELVMVAGYLVFESLILGLGASALIPAISNTVQGVINLILGVILTYTFNKISFSKKL